jgi:hypothetical protein
MPRPALHRPEPPADATSRPLEIIAGDVRDRLTVLLNSSHVLRIAGASGDPDVLCALRLIEQQLYGLALLADELTDHCRPRRP